MYRRDQFIHEWLSCFYAKECGECCIVRTAGNERAVYLSLSIDFLRFFWNHSLFFLHRFTCKSRVKIQIESAFVNVQHVWKIEKKQSNKKKKRQKKKKKKNGKNHCITFSEFVLTGRKGLTRFPWFWKNDKIERCSVIAKANLSSSFGVSVDYSTTKRFGGRFFSDSRKKEKI